MSAPRELPPRPSLEQQKNAARDLLKAFQEGSPDAAARIRRHLPDKSRITLSDAQFVLAREYGLRSWRELRDAIEAARSPDHERRADELRRLVAARDVEGLRALRRAGSLPADLLNAPLFDFDAPALVHVAGSGDLPLVDCLLELGADPNRGSDWWAGSFQPLHFASGAVAERLLAAGARVDACAAAHLDRRDDLERLLEEDPQRVHERGGDGQTPLHFARSREVIDLLLARGADIDARDVDHRATPAEWMLDQRRPGGRYELAGYLVERGASADVFLAAALGRVDFLQRLIDQDPSVVHLRTSTGEYGEKPPSSFHIYTWSIGTRLTPLQVAAQFEQHEAAALLARQVSAAEQLTAACFAGDAAAAERLVARLPGLVSSLGPDEVRTLPDAAWHGRVAAVELMLRLGFPPEARGQDGGTVLHCAAWQGWAQVVEAALRYPAVAALLEVRDTTHHSTALGWCFHGARYRRNPAGDYVAVARRLLAAGAKPGPNLGDAPADLLASVGLSAARGA